MADRPVCPTCKEFGIHQTAEQCIDELRAAIDQARRLLALGRDRSVEETGQYVPSYLQ